MRLYVNDKKTNRKIYIRANVNSRQELVQKLKTEEFTVKKETYNVNDVVAIPSIRYSNWRDVLFGGKKIDEDKAEKFNRTKVQCAKMKGNLKNELKK